MGVLLSGLVSLFLVAWIVMLALGAAYHEISSKVPHPGYWATLLCVWALSLIVSLVRR